MLISREDIETYKFPGLAALNEQQVGFFIDVMNGVSPTTAYKKYYGEEETKTPISVKAYAQTKKDWFKKYQQHYEKLIMEREIKESGWNFDLAILERRRIYSLNLQEVERLAQASREEIEYYAKKKSEAIEREDEDAIDYYEQKIIKAVKAKNMSLASNTACIQALDGLDKLAGLQTVNLNHTGNINFFGDDMWEDNVIDVNTLDGGNNAQQAICQQETEQDNEY